MKKLIVLLTLIVSSVSIISANDIHKLSKQEIQSMSDIERQERVDILEERVIEIESMDFDLMTRAERKESRKELNNIQKELKAHARGGIYISAGGVIVIVLLILIL